jgi:hypothetical protein
MEKRQNWPFSWDFRTTSTIKKCSELTLILFRSQQWCSYSHDFQSSLEEINTPHVKSKHCSRRETCNVRLQSKTVRNEHCLFSHIFIHPINNSWSTEESVSIHVWFWDVDNLTSIGISGLVGFLFWGTEIFLNTFQLELFGSTSRSRDLTSISADFYPFQCEKMSGDDHLIHSADRHVVRHTPEEDVYSIVWVLCVLEDWTMFLI